MTEYTEYDKIINVSGLEEDEIPVGDVASWSHPSQMYRAAIQTLCEPEIYCPEEALTLFVSLVTLMKNDFYMGIAQRISSQEDVVPSDESLKHFADSLNEKGFGKTVLLGPYRNAEFTGMVVRWCEEHDFFPLYPFSMDCSLEDFVDRQMVLEEHTVIC